MKKWTVAVAMAVVACGGDSGTDPSGDALLLVSQQDELVVLTQRKTPSVGMEALFHGSIDADGTGCIRLDGGDGATVIWPLGYQIRRDEDRTLVVDSGDDVVGTLGRGFEFAGGFVSELHGGMGFTDGDRERARVCPGTYWIVNDG